MKLNWPAFARLLPIGLALAAFCCPGFSLAGLSDQGNQERTMLPMQPATLSPGTKIPPVDAEVPAHTETATFALG
ncbi:MAG: hypothetical protein ACYC6G_15085 [Desulfobaccales bacterium]